MCGRAVHFRPPYSLYRDYVYNSSFPYTVELDNRRNIYAYLDGLFNTIVLNDIVQRKKIQDPLMLKSVIKFMFDNIGNPCTAKKISDTMTSKGRKISNHTVENYLEGLTDSLLMYRVSRYDIKGKEYLQLFDKYYIADVGLRYYLLGTANADMGHILENVVYLELLRRGYRVGLPGQIPDPAGKQGFLFFVFHLYIFYMSLCLVCRAVPVSHLFGETAGMMYNRTVVLLENAGCPQKGAQT